MAFHYVDDIATVLARIHEALVPAGRLLFSTIHPVITSGNNPPDGPRFTQVVDNYFSSGRRQREWFGRSVEWHHRTIEQYVSLVAAAGFTLTALRECEPVKDLFDGNEAEYERRRRVPLFLLLHAERAR